MIKYRNNKKKNNTYHIKEMRFKDFFLFLHNCGTSCKEER